MARPRLSHAEILERRARRFADRVCWETPAIRAFLERPAVTVVPFPSGGVWVFIGPTRGFYGVTKLEAVEAAMQAVENFPRERP